MKKIVILFLFSSTLFYANKEPLDLSALTKQEQLNVYKFCTDPIFLTRTPIPALVINVGQRIGLQFHNDVYCAQSRKGIITIKQAIQSMSAYAHTLPDGKRCMDEEDLKKIAPLIKTLYTQLIAEKAGAQHTARL